MELAKKQFLALSIMVLFYSPLIYYEVLYEKPTIPLVSGLLWLFGAISVPIIHFIWGKDNDFKSQTSKFENYSSLGEWIKNSNDLHARLIRWSLVLATVTLIFSIGFIFIIEFLRMRL